MKKEWTKMRLKPMAAISKSYSHFARYKWYKNKKIIYINNVRDEFKAFGVKYPKGFFNEKSHMWIVYTENILGVSGKITLTTNTKMLKDFIELESAIEYAENYMKKN